MRRDNDPLTALYLAQVSRKMSFQFSDGNLHLVNVVTNLEM
jgi:hypothetical protein